MVAVDTNVLIRLLTEDDVPQAEQALKLFGTQEIRVAKTVLLETDGVLRSFYGFEAKAVCDAFVALLGLSNLRAEDPASVARALDMTAKGIESPMPCTAAAALRAAASHPSIRHRYAGQSARELMCERQVSRLKWRGWMELVNRYFPDPALRHFEASTPKASSNQ